jgi:hypothetical protein
VSGTAAAGTARSVAPPGGAAAHSASLTRLPRWPAIGTPPFVALTLSFFVAILSVSPRPLLQ